MIERGAFLKAYLKGKWRKSLSYFVALELRAWNNGNTTLENNRWTLLNKDLIFWAQKPWLYAFLVAFLFSVLTVLLARLSGLGYLNGISTKFFVLASEPEFSRAILAGQITLIALIYPIVIGFMGSSLKSSNAQSILQKLYAEKSGFVFASLSGIALIITWLLRAVVLEKNFPLEYLIFGGALVIWFVANLSLLAYFLVFTARFYQPSQRAKLLRQYILNNELVNEIRQRVAENIPREVDSRNIITTKLSNNRLLSANYGFGEAGDSLLVIDSKSNYLQNIHYSIVEKAIAAWETSQLALVDKDSHKLELPLTVDLEPFNHFMIARSSIILNWEVRRKLKKAYPINGNIPFPRSELKLWLEASADLVTDPINTGREREFDDALANFENIWIDIIRATHRDPIGKNVYPWLFQRGSNMFKSTIFGNFEIEYAKLVQEASEKLSDNSHWFRNLCLLPSRIFIGSGSHDDELAVALQRVSNRAWAALVSFRKNSNDDLNDLGLTTYVGCWERWGRLYLIDREKSIDRKKQFEGHLIFTADSAITALRANDFTALSWAIDMLIYWHENMFTQIDFHDFDPHFIDREWFVTTDDFKRDENGSVKFQFAIWNYWNDIRNIVVLRLWNWSNNAVQMSESELDGLTTNLMELKPIYPTGSRYVLREQASDGWSILAGLLRMNSHYLSNGSYRVQISSVVRNMSEFYKQNSIAGRSAFLGGGTELRSYQDEQILLLVKSFDRPSRILRKATSAILSQEAEFIEGALHYLSTLLFRMKTAVQNLELDDGSSASKFVGNENCEATISTLEKIVENLNRTVRADLEQREVTENTLTLIAGRTQVLLFTETESKFPLNLFTRIKVEEIDKNLSVDVFCQKELLVHYEEIGFEEFDARVFVEAIEDEWVAAIFSTLNNEAVAGGGYSLDTIPGFLTSLVENTKSEFLVNQTPILIVYDFEIAQFLRNQLYGGDSQLPLKMIDNDNDNFIVNLGGIEVYEVYDEGVDRCLLTTKERFDRIRVKDESGKFVFVTYREEEDDSILNFRVEAEIEFMEDKTLKFERFL
jgi:hypothetical protein